MTTGTLTVKELIEILSNLNPEAKIVAYSHECEYKDFYYANCIEVIENGKKVAIYHS